MRNVVPIALILTAFAADARAQSLGPPPVPPENPITEAKRVLGKTLFWDEQLSSDNTVACGTCHIPSAGGSDPRVGLESRHPGLDQVYGNDDDRFASAGVRNADASGHYQPDAEFGFERQVTPRRSPTNLAAAYFDDLFWDGRATSKFTDPVSGLVSIVSGGALESQSLGPILSFVEMADDGRTWNDVVTKLERVKPLALATNLNVDLVAALSNDETYPDLFTVAFGDPAITPERIAYALATYQRTLIPDQTPWDLFQQGQSGALTSTEIAGMNSFMSTGNKCSVCHEPPLFADGSYRNLGLRDILEDEGRRATTGLFSDRGKFKVPTLRNVGLRTRFFHNGEPTFFPLNFAVSLYNQGAGFFLENKDPILASVFISPGTAANITAFLTGGLTDPRVAAELPPFDRPTLWSERGDAATTSGVARAGSGGFEPQIVAQSPALIGNAEFRVGLSGALGGSTALLVFGLNINVLPSVAPPGLQPRQMSVTRRILWSTPTNGVGAGDGWATFAQPIPNVPALAGWEFGFRWLVADAGAVNGWSRTQKSTFKVF